MLANQLEFCFTLGDESFEASYLGDAAEVSQDRISDDELIIIKGYGKLRITN